MKGMIKTEIDMKEINIFSIFFLSVPYHGSSHDIEILCFSLNKRLGIREGPSQCPTPKPPLYIYKYKYKHIFLKSILKEHFQLF